MVVVYLKTCASASINMKISQNNIIILSIIVFDISHVDSQLMYLTSTSRIMASRQWAV
jgi:hypothetical protein